MPKKLILLGCTGSIGEHTLQVVSSFPELYTVAAVSSHRSAETLVAVKTSFGADKAALSGSDGDRTCPEIEYYGEAGMLEMIAATDAEIVVNGISGAAGLKPSIAALKAGKDLILANKETIVMAGSLIFSLAEKHGCRIIPVDSEHSAILQLVRFRPESYLDRIILTASGGPFRTTPAEQFSRIRPRDALRHPTWNMGPKISIDSSTLANKGLEIIETHYFFGIPASKIEVVIHPQSIVHSLIATADGCLYAQLGSTNMSVPIANALAYPDIARENIAPFTLTGRTLSFEQPDTGKFPLLNLAYKALEAGGGYMIAYNAANEAAVEQFLSGGIRYTGIPETVESVLQKDWSSVPADFDEVFAIDAACRRISREIMHLL